VPLNKIVLLPGMDGTGNLYRDFIRALPNGMKKETPRYPKERARSYSDLTKLVRFHCEDSELFVLLAESFSTPVAIRVAAENPTNLKGLILCAGFATSPFSGLSQMLGWFLAPVLMRMPLSDAVMRARLTGMDAPAALLREVREAVASVNANVLATRLRSILKCNVCEELTRIAIPVLYLQAAQDRLVRSRCLDEIQRIKPDVRSIIMNGPHLLLQTNPEEAGRAVADFCRALS
jgi:pimeloyl-[acyl-carrier protein] methyl ester esterase